MGKYFLILVTIVLVATSCATRRNVEYRDREVVRYVTKVQHDTTIINVHDSVFHNVYQRGDTVYDTKYIEKIIFKDKILVQTDTIMKDSIQVEFKEVFVEVKKIPKICYFSFGICAIFLIFAIVKLVRWLKIL